MYMAGEGGVGGKDAGIGGACARAHMHMRGVRGGPHYS